MTHISGLIRKAGIGLIVASLAGTACASPTAIGNYNDWKVYRDTVDGQTVCYAATPATDKAPKAANHGDVWFFVTSWKSGRTANQPSLKVGFDLRDDLPPKARVGASSFTMFSYGDEAFVADEDDPRLVRALKRGSELRVEAVSAKETSVAYHFSLKGSSKAIEKAASTCR